MTDKGYHSRAVLKALDNGPWKTRLAEPKQKGFARWRGDEAARRAVTNNRTRLLSGVAKEAFKLRAEIVERSFAHNLDRGGMAPDLASGPRERAQAIPAPRRRPQPIVADAPTHRRRHPGARPWRADMAVFSCCSRPPGPCWSHWGSRKAARRFSPPHSSSGSESRKKPLNQRAAKSVNANFPGIHIFV